MKLVEPLADILDSRLPDRGLVLELGSGGGPQVTYIARRFPHLNWQPSHPDPSIRKDITQSLERSGLSNVRAPLDIDPEIDRPWPITNVEAIVGHHFTATLLARAADLLSAGGQLFLVVGDGAHAASPAFRLNEKIALKGGTHLLVFERKGSSGQSGSTPSK